MAKAPAPAAPGRGERIIAYMIVSTIGLSILAIIAVLIGTATGAGADRGFSGGIWPLIFVLPLVGLPIGFILIILLLVLSALRRGRATKR